MKTQHAILAMCQLLKVSPSGFYDWQQRRDCPSPRAMADQKLTGQITTVFAGSRQTYGSPRVQQELDQQGCSHGRNRIARLMKAAGLCGRQKRRYRVQTTNSKHDQPIAPNRLAEAPKATAPNQIWVADITYIETQEGWLYLAGRINESVTQISGGNDNCPLSPRERVRGNSARN